MSRAPPAVGRRCRQAAPRAAARRSRRRGQRCTAAAGAPGGPVPSVRPAAVTRTRPAGTRASGGDQIEGRQAVRELLHRRAAQGPAKCGCRASSSSDGSPDDAVADIVALAAAEPGAGGSTSAAGQARRPRPQRGAAGGHRLRRRAAGSRSRRAVLRRTGRAAAVPRRRRRRHRSRQPRGDHPQLRRRRRRRGAGAAAPGGAHHTDGGQGVGGRGRARPDRRWCRGAGDAGPAQRAGIWVVGLDDAADRSLFDIADLATDGICLVLGAEGAGLSRLVRERCDVVVAIPMRGRVESLNVAAAAALATYEVFRHRA